MLGVSDSPTNLIGRWRLSNTHATYSTTRQQYICNSGVEIQQASSVGSKVGQFILRNGRAFHTEQQQRRDKASAVIAHYIDHHHFTVHVPQSLSQLFVMYNTIDSITINDLDCVLSTTYRMEDSESDGDRQHCLSAANSHSTKATKENVYNCHLYKADKKSKRPSDCRFGF